MSHYAGCVQDLEIDGLPVMKNKESIFFVL